MQNGKYINSGSLLRYCLLISAILIIAIYFMYQPFSWPVGLEALACLVALLIFLMAAILLWVFRNKPIITNQQTNISIGLAIGLLWTIEIGINNLIHPGLPLRDIIDDLFWAFIALLILYCAVASAYKKRKIAAAIIAGFWTGTASGAIACVTALSLIVFGMHFILNDPLNIKEWADTHKNLHYPGMHVYFAYQTFAGAILHLTVLGTLMGLILGLVGGVLGKSISLIYKHK